MYPSCLNELVYSEDMVLLSDFKDLQNDNSKDMKAKFHFFTKKWAPPEMPTSYIFRTGQNKLFHLLSTELPIPLTINPFTLRLSSDEMISHVNVCICWQNPMMLPFKWIRPRNTFTWCYFFSNNFVVLTFESVNKILWCYHSNETSSVVLSRGTIHLVCSSNFWVCGQNPIVLPLKWNLFSSTFTWCYSFSM